MKEKTYYILLIILAVLLGISIFFNGWLLHSIFSGSDFTGSSGSNLFQSNTAPENS